MSFLMCIQLPFGLFGYAAMRACEHVALELVVLSFHVHFQPELCHKLPWADSAKDWVHNTIGVFSLPVFVNSMFICPDFGMVGTVWVSTFKPKNTIKQTYLISILSLVLY